MKAIKKDNAHVVVLEKGEEIMQTLTKYVADNDIRGGLVKGIGALQDVVIGYFDVEKKDYNRREIVESCELLNFLGNISMVDRKHFIHAHVILTKGDFTVEGGHLFSGVVSVTAEMYIYPFEHEINRDFNDDVMLNLINFS